jgi:hypothetical protein
LPRLATWHDWILGIAGVESTDLFAGTPQRPPQVVRVTVVNENPATAAATVRIHGPEARVATGRSV